jgi:hypothetical protein
MGFTASKTHTSLFIYKTKNTTIYVLVYVDGIIIASSYSKTTSALNDQLRKEFVVNDLGDLHYFLGIEVTKQRGGLLLTQQKYTAEMLQKARM